MAIGIAGTASIASVMPVESSTGSGTFALDAGVAPTPFRFESSVPRFSFTLTPEAPSKSFTGTVRLSSVLTAGLRTFQRPHAMVLFDLQGLDVSANRSVTVSFGMQPPTQASDVDSGAPEDAGIPEDAASVSDTLTLGENGTWVRSTTAFDPDWSSCGIGQECSAHFHITVASTLDTGRIVVTGQTQWLLDAMISVPTDPFFFLRDQITIEFDSDSDQAEPDGIDGG